MNINTLNTSKTNAIIACDVSKDTINLVYKFGKFPIERKIRNHTIVLEKELNQIKDFAHHCGYQSIWVVAEPTGIYHKALFMAAKRIDLHTAYVSTESVCKMRVIETNDTGKHFILRVFNQRPGGFTHFFRFKNSPKECVGIHQISHDKSRSSSVILKSLCMMQLARPFRGPSFLGCFWP